MTLKSKKMKVTPQRLAIYEYLAQAKSHPCVETIYKTLKPDYPAMSLATVYKTLGALQHSGLIQELNVGEGRFRYDADIRPHAHFYCAGCQQVFDLPELDALEALRQELEAKTDFVVTNELLYVYGVCQSCANTPQGMME